MKTKKGTLFIIIGLLLIVLALFIIGNNIYDEYIANKSSTSAINQLIELIPENKGISDYILDPNMEMPIATIDGWDYVGIISIDTLDVILPVIDQWSEEASYISPCRYYGSVYKNDMVIAAHNFPSHFGKISDLTIEDKIVFTDMAGNSFYYRPVTLEVLAPTDIEKMTDGENDLTLFTCTIGGQKRVTIRCERIIE